MRRTRSILVLAFLLSGCTTMPVAAGWEREVVLSTGTKLGGCAIGDLDPARPGLEIAAVAQNGDVWVLWRDGATWRGEVAANVGGEMNRCAIGDADLDRPGDELIVVGIGAGLEDAGGPGRAHVVYRDGAGWRAEPIFDGAALLQAVWIEPGEVFIGGLAQRAFRLVRGPSGWRSDPIATLPGSAKAAVAARGGVVFACQDGSVALVRRDGAGWTNGVIDRRTVGRACLASDGERLLVADDDGQVELIDADGRLEKLYRARQRLRGVVFADLDRGAPGLEAATVGYDRQVVLVRRTAEGWQPLLIAQEGDRLHDLACGDVDPAPGLELVVVGHAGDIVMFRVRR